MALDYLSDNFDRQFGKHIDSDYEKADLAELYAIPAYKRYPGMMSYVLNTGTSEKVLYILKAKPGDNLSDNNYWEPWESGNSQLGITAQQIAYVDDANGNDATGIVDDPTHPFKTIKPAIDALRGVISFVRIASGDYVCPEEVLQDIDPVVSSLVIDSKATTITATTSFVLANQASISEFKFYGGGTDITAGLSTFLIDGSNIYVLEMSANNVHGDSTAIQIIHPGTNNIVINGNVSSGTGDGYALSIRGAALTNLFVRGDITCEGTNIYSAGIKVRDVHGVLNVAWGGKLIATNLGHTQANAINVSNNNIGAKINFHGDVVDERTDTSVAAIWLRQDFTYYEHRGNISRSKGNCVSISDNSAIETKVVINGALNAIDGSVFAKSGNRDLEAYLNLSESSYKTQGFYLGEKINLYFSGAIENVIESNPLFAFPATIPAGVNVFIGDIEFKAFADTTPLALTGTFTGQLNVTVKGAFRTNSTAAIPSHLNLVWLKDITASNGGVDLSELVRKDGTTPFTGRQKGVAATEADDLVIYSQLGVVRTTEINTTGHIDNTEPYELRLTNNEATDNGRVTVDSWVDGENAVSVFINGVLLDKNDWFEEGGEIVIRPGFEIESDDLITLKVLYYYESPSFVTCPGPVTAAPDGTDNMNVPNATQIDGDVEQSSDSLVTVDFENETPSGYPQYINPGDVQPDKWFWFTAQRFYHYLRSVPPSGNVVIAIELYDAVTGNIIAAQDTADVGERTQIEVSGLVKGRKYYARFYPMYSGTLPAGQASSDLSVYRIPFVKLSASECDGTFVLDPPSGSDLIHATYPVNQFGLENYTFKFVESEFPYREFEVWSPNGSNPSFTLSWADEFLESGRSYCVYAKARMYKGPNWGDYGDGCQIHIVGP